jgi:hypothetical protein
MNMMMNTLALLFSAGIINLGRSFYALDFESHPLTDRRGLTKLKNSAFNRYEGGARDDQVWDKLGQAIGNLQALKEWSHWGNGSYPP